ncbi:ribosome biogenesis factor YjgA [uncultured Nitrosomonas sp.]|uniref:ribosome biogenesis factor YjgA n=1 Tax=uncultured Nitrosomonas sp. TaxID=156424 RepID=UPI0025F4BB80|nr:ribosome biogenesis factor YjgA [uncultured Nitrosomonas sp.]
MQKELKNEIEQDTAPSKTQRKKDMHALQEIGEQLVELDPKKLTEFDLPETLKDAIQQARSIQKHGARRRQLQYIGRLMRNVDALPIQQKLDSWRQVSVHQTARLHQLERWRERLLSEEHALTEFAQQYPAADLQRLRLLIRNAHKEKTADKPPKSFRLLFQELQEIITEV